MFHLTKLEAIASKTSQHLISSRKQNISRADRVRGALWKSRGVLVLRGGVRSSRAPASSRPRSTRLLLEGLVGQPNIGAREGLRPAGQQDVSIPRLVDQHLDGFNQVTSTENELPPTDPNRNDRKRCPKCPRHESFQHACAGCKVYFHIHNGPLPWGVHRL